MGAAIILLVNNHLLINLFLPQDPFLKEGFGVTKRPHFLGILQPKAVLLPIVSI